MTLSPLSFFHFSFPIRCSFIAFAFFWLKFFGCWLIYFSCWFLCCCVWPTSVNRYISLAALFYFIFIDPIHLINFSMHVLIHPFCNFFLPSFWEPIAWDNICELTREAYLLMIGKRFLFILHPLHNSESGCFPDWLYNWQQFKLYIGFFPALPFSCHHIFCFCCTLLHDVMREFRTSGIILVLPLARLRFCLRMLTVPSLPFHWSGDGLLRTWELKLYMSTCLSFSALVWLVVACMGISCMGVSCTGIGCMGIIAALLLCLANSFSALSNLYLGCMGLWFWLASLSFCSQCRHSVYVGNSSLLDLLFWFLHFEVGYFCCKSHVICTQHKF